MAESNSNTQALLSFHQNDILLVWLQAQRDLLGRRISEGELKLQFQEFLALLIEGLRSGDVQSLQSSGWTNLKKLLSNISRSRGTQGFTPSETALFVLSLKRPIFDVLRKEFSGKPEVFAEEVLKLDHTLDQLALFTMEEYQKTREELISRQQEEMLELSTPVVKLWEGVLALPMIGTLDSSRTQVVMESLLQKIMETGSEIAIIDITGVPTVDTLVAQHLIKTVTAARLMGAECIISGIRPQIAATIVHLGVDLGGIATKASLADAFVLALKKLGKGIGRPPTQNSRV